MEDWACRKGHHDGTILVDLERHELVDLLPDRSAESLATWLKAHPEIEILSRDRAGVYADGARPGAPQAEPGADRWHLLGTLGEALERLTAQPAPDLREAAQQIAPDAAPPQTTERAVPAPLTASLQRRLARQETRHEHEDQIPEAQGLRQDGTSLQNAVSMEWSNGQVEGQVNRLKRVKRQRYGRAHFDLLRARVMPMAQAA